MYILCQLTVSYTGVLIDNEHFQFLFFNFFKFKKSVCNIGPCHQFKLWHLQQTIGIPLKHSLFLRYKEILLFNLVIIETKKILIDLITKITIYLLTCNGDYWFFKIRFTLTMNWVNDKSYLDLLKYKSWVLFLISDLFCI